MRCVTLLVCVALLLLPEPAPALADRSEIVKTWARVLGNDLWRLSESLTKSEKIRMKYNTMNASVGKKNGDLILQSSLVSVSSMLTRKINAVKCIHATAERLAREFNYSMVNNMVEPDDEESANKDDGLNFTFCSSKYSYFEYEKDVEPPASKLDRPRFAINNKHYMNLSLEKDSHFYDISVNTNTSCVQVPTNIYYKEKAALASILWSKDLNDVFRQNYQSDPSLSWQYFGSSHGIFRFYPGMPWKQDVDTYDCRVKSWYIEAATCSKDVIILFDVSGSMTGFKNYVARTTLNSLLSTLSNNDYVNVYTFKNATAEVIDCFVGLVQATPENIKTIEKTLEPYNDGKTHNVPLEGNANLTAAYIKAFSTLKEKRQQCNVTSTQGCNQLVMVITDYVPGNLTEVFENYNREIVDGVTYIPVRVFTYLVGKEVTNVDEIRWMACLNRGYFVHIHSVEEVQQQVLKYINVIARPMILAGENPPPTWTHANIDDTRLKLWNVSGDINKPDEDKLVTSVAIPAFDYKFNDEEDDDARLLGVAGTDVPIDSIAKLAQPHQLGVNGYPLIVSNNGYLLLHPLLITTINGKLQDNYNSVDFVEVEQVDDGKGPRELGDKIKQLRQHLVNGDQGSMLGVEVLFHYDKMRRISRVKHDYFFNKLEGTPFSMGISLPRGYGITELVLRDNPLEAKQGQDVTGINVTDYFRTNFRVHPDWVYCKYHYLEGHEADNPEIEIWRFLVLLSHNNITITKQQYTEEKNPQPFNVETHCGDALEKKQLDKDDYYCTEDLVKQLVFDAKLTTPFFEEWEHTPQEEEQASRYGVSVRFIATSSGLTRWHYIFDKHKNEKVQDDGTRTKEYEGSIFGDRNNNSIEATWYKAAVLQHMIDKESLVISTKLPTLDTSIKDRPIVANADGDINVTASYAIFYKDGDSDETPASVVGFQFLYSKFHEKFMDITRKSSTEDFICGKNYACYLIDSSGYVVLSAKDPNNRTEVGSFFGAIDTSTNVVMEKLLQLNIFQVVEVFNYQALCPESVLPPKPNSSWRLLTPFSVIGNFVKWLMTELVLGIMNWNQPSYAFTVTDGEEEAQTEYNETIIKDVEAQEEETFSCDHEIKLYMLNQTYFLNNMGLTKLVHVNNNPDENCSPPTFWASLVTKTNTLLVVVETSETKLDPECAKTPDTTPRHTASSIRHREPCHKLDLASLPRRRLEGCFTYHDKERNITACGKGNRVRGDILLFLAAVTSGLASSWFTS